MPKQRRSTLADLSRERPIPAFVVSLDLVRHSTRSPEDIERIQSTLQSVLDEVLATFPGDRIIVNYTGDGYLCALCNDAASGGIEFLDMLTCRLRDALPQHGQAFRIGADFGFIQPEQNAVTNRLEYFAQPGIRATRLQAASDPNSALLSHEVYALFSPITQAPLAGDPKIVKVKEHELVAYTFLQRSAEELLALREILSEILASSRSGEAATLHGRIVLVSDDDLATRSLLGSILSGLGARMIETENGAQAIAECKLQMPDAVITDLLMPRVDGYGVIDYIESTNPGVPILVVTGVQSASVLDHPHVPLFRKPLPLGAIEIALQLVLRSGTWERVRSAFPDAGTVIAELSTIAASLVEFRDLHKGADAVDGLLRHKAKEYVHTYLQSVRVGHPGVTSARTLRRRLERLATLGQKIRHAGEVGFLRYIESISSDIASDNPELRIRIQAAERAVALVNDASLGGAVLLCAAELLNNARDATAGKGEITVELTRRESENAIRLSVRNTGPGIPRQLASTIFGEGVTTKGENRGLGLSLVKRLAESLNGQVALAQAGNVTFSVIFPAPPVRA